MRVLGHVGEQLAVHLVVELVDLVVARDHFLGQHGVVGQDEADSAMQFYCKASAGIAIGDEGHWTTFVG